MKSIFLRRILPLIIIPVIFLPCLRCGSFTVVKTNTGTGYFPTAEKVKPEEISIKSKIDINSYKGLLVIAPLKYFDPDSRKNIIPTEFDPFYIQSVINMNFFDTVIFAKDLSDEKKAIKHLVSEVYIARYGSFEYKMTLTLKDSESGKKVFSVEKNAVNKSGLEEPLFYPVFNSMIEWIKENRN